MRSLAILTSLLLFVVESSAGAQQAGDPGAGASYAKQLCAKCHAIEGTDASPNRKAPRFRDVANTPGMTATALTVWLKTSHPTMPDIVIEQTDMDNVIAFILSLKE
jgi:cytochrome c2